MQSLKIQYQNEIIEKIMIDLQSVSYSELPEFGSELQQIAAERLLYQAGWKFDPEPRKDKPVYSWGWWYKPNGERMTPRRKEGDSQDVKVGAWQAYRNYEVYYAE